MFPDQQNQNGGQPQYQPNPQTGVNSAPQQAANGQYEVLPTLPTMNNTGHSGHNPYEFIVNPNTPKRSVSLFGGNGFAKRIAVIVGGAVVLMVVIAVVVSALAPKGSTVTDMTSIAARQQEIIRVASAATTKSTGQDTMNFVTNVDASVTSSQQQFISYLSGHGTKLKAKELGVDQNAQTDTLLANAATANNYDSAVTQGLTTQLQTYEGQLQTAYTHAKSTQAKLVLKTAYDSAATLLKQAKTLPSGN